MVFLSITVNESRIEESGVVVFERSYDLTTCEHVAIPVIVNASQTLVVEWVADDDEILVGVGTKSDLADFETIVSACDRATVYFPFMFKIVGGGMRGSIEFTAPVPATYYVVIFHKWHPAQTTIHIHVKIKITISTAFS